MRKIFLFIGFSLFYISSLYAGFNQSGFNKNGFSTFETSTENELKKIGGLTFYKNFQATKRSLNADHAVGSPTATYTAARSASAPATYVDGAGVVQLLTTADVRRRQGGYYDATGFHAQSGEMIEAAGTNLIKNSSALGGVVDADSWDRPAATVMWPGIFINSGAATLSIDSTSPYGGGMKFEITNDGTVANTDIIFRNSGINNLFSMANSTVYTLSFLSKSSVAGKIIPVETVDSATQLVNLGLNSSFTTTTSWSKFSVTFTSAVSAGNTLVRFLLGNNGLFDISIDCLQLEASPYATSFIPTTTAALTRPAEVLKYETSGNRTAATETMFVKFAPESTFANDSIERWISATDTKIRQIRKAGTLSVLLFRPNATDSVNSFAQATTTNLINTSYVVAARSVNPTGNPNAEIFINGIQEGDDSDNDIDYTSPAWGTSFYLGSNTSGALQLNGVIQSVCIYNRALTAAEVLAVVNILNNGGL